MGATQCPCVSAADGHLRSDVGPTLCPNWVFRFHRTAVCALSFSSNGKLLLSVDASEDHGIAIYKWCGHLDFEGVWTISPTCLSAVFRIPTRTV